MGLYSSTDRVLKGIRFPLKIWQSPYRRLGFKINGPPKS